MYYIDTSALMKLIVAERDSQAMRHWMARATDHVIGSELLCTEFLRAVRRSVPSREPAAHEILASILLVRLTRATFDHAAVCQPESLRSLDALHLASAMELGDELKGIVTYDERLAEAARANGIEVFAPR